MLQGVAHAGRRHRRVDAQARAQRHRRDERAVGAQAARRSARAELLDKFRATTRRAPRGVVRRLASRVERDHRDAGGPGHATGGSCGCGSSTAGCTNTTSETRSACRRRRARGPGRRGWRSMRWRPAWASSSASSAARRTDRGCAIELTGPLARTINVAIEGRGQGGRRLRRRGSRRRRSRSTGCCSPGWRAAGPPVPTHDAVSYGGDEAVGRRVVEHLNYVI